jgi:hypothetical protein
MLAVEMAFAEIWFYFLVAAAAVLAAVSRWAPWLIYVNAVVLLALLGLQIVILPHYLNRSRNFYGLLLRRQFFFVFYSGFIYGFHFYFGGLFGPDKSRGTILDGIYFSFTTWTTLGYGDFVTAPSMRLATSIEALTGVFSIAVLTATIWFYCSERLKPRSADLEHYLAGGHLDLRGVNAFGMFQELDSDETRVADELRQRVAVLSPCPQCGKPVRINRYFDFTGSLAVFAWFVVLCECGAHSRPRRNAFLAEHEWNRNGPVRLRKSSGSLRAYIMPYVVMLPGRVVAMLRDAFRWLRRRRASK